MDSLSTPRRLPTIDLSKEDLKEGTTDWGAVRKEVVQALEEYGCFEARYDKVTLVLYNQVLRIMEDVFNLPEENKQRFVDLRKPYDGYIPNTPQLPFYEAMAISGALDSDAIKTCFDLIGLEDSSTTPSKDKISFCEVLRSYALRLSHLEQLITKMIFESLGVEKYLESHEKKLTHSIRLTKYKAPNSDERQIGATAHHDKNFLTILQQNEVDGLEVQLKNGTWIQTAPSASTFIVMIGESFLGWCNGRLYCPKHHVMMRGHKTRYSVGLFSALKGMIQSPEELVDDQHPLLFKPFDEVSLLRFHLTEEGRKAESTLKAYCGIANDGLGEAAMGRGACLIGRTN